MSRIERYDVSFTGVCSANDVVDSSEEENHAWQLISDSPRSSSIRHDDITLHGIVRDWSIRQKFRPAAVEVNPLSTVAGTEIPGTRRGAADQGLLGRVVQTDAVYPVWNRRRT